MENINFVLLGAFAIAVILASFAAYQNENLRDDNERLRGERDMHHNTVLEVLEEREQQRRRAEYYRHEYMRIIFFMTDEDRERMRYEPKPPYMDFPRKSSVNACAGCVHEETNRGSFPCDKCKRMLRGEHDMFVKKVEE